MEKNIVCAVDLDTVIGVSWAERGTGAKLVFDAHEIYYEVPELTGKPLKKSIWKSIAKRYLPRIKAAYTVNHSLKLHHQKYSNDYQVIRNVPPLSSSTPAVKQNNKILVYLGVLNAGRGVELYIDAMKQLPEYKLMIIGEGDLSEELRKRAADHASITFCGYRKPDEIFDLLGEASIGLNMLRAESLNYKLSLANKFFDYMHAGLPSINMDYPEYSQIISKDRVGLLTKAYTIESLVSAVRSLENASLYKELSENAISAREEYNWEKEEQKLLSFYSQS